MDGLAEAWLTGGSRRRSWGRWRHPLNLTGGGDRSGTAEATIGTGRRRRRERPGVVAAGSATPDGLKGPGIECRHALLVPGTPLPPRPPTAHRGHRATPSRVSTFDGCRRTNSDARLPRGDSERCIRARTAAPDPRSPASTRTHRRPAGPEAYHFRARIRRCTFRRPPRIDDAGAGYDVECPSPTGVPSFGDPRGRTPIATPAMASHLRPGLTNPTVRHSAGPAEATCKPSSVPPTRRSTGMAIHLRRRSPGGFSGRPEGWAARLSPRRTGVAPSYLALLRVEFAAFHSGRRLAPSPGIVTVALVLASRRTGVTRYPALGSSDFPRAEPLPAGPRPSDRLVGRPILVDLCRYGPERSGRRQPRCLDMWSLRGSGGTASDPGGGRSSRAAGQGRSITSLQARRRRVLGPPDVGGRPPLNRPVRFASPWSAWSFVSFTRHRPFSCSTMRSESRRSLTSRAPSSAARASERTTAVYSATLFV